MREGDSLVGRGGVESPASREWLLKRDGALSSRQMMLYFLPLATVSFLIAIGFAIAGAWLVLPFAGLEIGALALALWIFGRHREDYDRVTLESEGLVVERVVSGRQEKVRMNPLWVRIEESKAGSAVVLRERGQGVAIGRHVGERERRLFAQDLRRALARA